MQSASTSGAANTGTPVTAARFSASPDRAYTRATPCGPSTSTVGGISARHYPVQPDFADPATKTMHQRRGELVGHRAAPRHALQARGEAKGLRIADLDHQMPIPIQVIQHHELGQVVAVLKPDKLAVADMPALTNTSEHTDAER